MERISIKEACSILGMSAPTLRVLMQRGVLDIGECVAPTRPDGKWQYYIYRSKVMKVVGKGEEDEGSN